MPHRNGCNPQVYQTIAVGLGWFGVGLGLAQLIAPRGLARFIGIRTDPNLLRLLGVRELATGIGILAKPRQSNWLHARVMGDALELALLGAAAGRRKNHRSRVAVATAAAAGVTAMDIICSLQLTRHPAPGSIRLSRCITINRGPEELYDRWRNLEDLPDYMSHLQAVFVTGDKTSHWIAKAPAGIRIEWDAEIVEDRPNEFLAWKSMPGGAVQNSGSVSFEPATGNRGTVVRVELEYTPPPGSLRAVVARVFGASPGKQIAVDLLRFKQKVETGEIARTEGQPAGRKRSASRLFDAMVRA